MPDADVGPTSDAERTRAWTHHDISFNLLDTSCVVDKEQVSRSPYKVIWQVNIPCKSQIATNRSCLCTVILCAAARILSSRSPLTSPFPPAPIPYVFALRTSSSRSPLTPPPFPSAPTPFLSPVMAPCSLQKRFLTADSSGAHQITTNRSCSLIPCSARISLSHSPLTLLLFSPAPKCFLTADSPGAHRLSGLHCHNGNFAQTKSLP
ncbi:hypothetical protein EDB84DRAFT_226178 [Lactarius hengduanensis]|nr:hypothetical protein EDB84DRAFT_226178 [Lactarius hengduanensis]